MLTSKLVSGRETAVLTVPAGAKLLKVGYTPWRVNEVQVWFLVDPEITDTKQVEFVILGTGFGYVVQETAERLEFLDSIVTRAEEVYHCFMLHAPLPPRLAQCGCLSNLHGHRFGGRDRKVA